MVSRPRSEEFAISAVAAVVGEGRSASHGGTGVVPPGDIGWLKAR
jgi:hypothetical protein